MSPFFWIGCGAVAVCAAYVAGALGADWAAKQRVKRAMDAEPFPEPDDADIADGQDDEDVCLRVGMRVVCNLSPNSHTHGTIIGFTMHVSPDGPMLAIVNVGGDAPPMPINVDLIEPAKDSGPSPGYRTNASPNKQWN